MSQDRSWAHLIAGLLLGDDVDSVHDAWDIAQQGEQDVQPERPAEANLEEYTQRRQQDGDENADEVHAVLLGVHGGKIAVLAQTR